ncbi:MAG TPA: hypothetical protein VFR81_22350 [Longimicrobium sp.]|nr:hypothetical protein [Longimicrobium sp.]
MQFKKILSPITHVETISIGHGIRDLARLNATYGLGRWRKRKGVATVEMGNGEIRRAEVHWYEATGIGRRDFKIKRVLD